MEVAIIPRFIIKYMFHDDTKQIHANILFSNIFIILAFFSLHSCSDQLASIPHVCVFQKVLGIPCPGCGITRSLFSIVNGDMFLAWQYNPTGLLIFLFILMQIPLRIIALKFQNTAEMISKISRTGSIIVICLLFLVWVLKLTQ